MKINQVSLVKVFRHNIREIVFVFLAFTMMAAAAYFSVGRIIRERLLDRAEEIISTAEANVRAGLAESETVLLNTYNIVWGMIDQNASKQEILNYLISNTEWMRQHDRGLFGYYGIYGYINGEFYDSLGLNPGDDFIPQTRPWYQAAIRSGSSVSYTTPYIDWLTGDTVVSAVRNIFDRDGQIIGILTLDVEISWLAEYVSSLAEGMGGYGILINQNMTLLTHRDKTIIGSQLQDLGGSFNEIARILRSGGDVIAYRTKGTRQSIVFFTRIFNGWYVGIVTPAPLFYRDLYISAAILIIIGIVLSISLCFLLLRLSAAKIRSDEESKYKSSFLASMSHEIRTPMNAITGMAELLLRGELSDEARGYAQDIKLAGNNLISIINDILDISKIEAGKLEIIPARYLFSSLINDTVNIVRMKIGDKPIRFITNIDCNIPSALFGDEVRLRQMLLNLLSNAAKYTEKGFIGLYITVEGQDEKIVRLKFSVTDTGKGIKPEDQAVIFNEFVQVDVTKNRGIEGSGLGLSITKKLCSAMNGSISMESEYGKGSTFTMIIPQGIETQVSFAAVDEPEKKKVLVYEGRLIYAESVSWSLANMRVPFTIVSDKHSFEEALRREEWYFIFSGYGLYEIIKPIMDCYYGKKPQLALMVEWSSFSSETEGYIPDVRFVSLPVQSLSIANTLNGISDSKGYYEGSGIIKYTYPGVRILIVDDLTTNLKVAEGLLAPYNAKIDTCLSGIQAIEMIKHVHYDLVFMDHMMPEMDGIEATALIRTWEKDETSSSIPIVALTANAVAGMREMFLKKGFNDFLAKPIDVSRLDEILKRWIPEEKREIKISAKADNENILFSISGVDTVKGISRTGGTVENYFAVLTMYRTDAEERLSILKNIPDAASLSLFTTHVHALKSASASIGADNVSIKAAELEAAARAADFRLIGDKLNDFTADLEYLINGIHKIITLHNEQLAQTLDKNASSNFEPLLQELKSALVSNKASSDIFIILDELNKIPLDLKTREVTEKIAFQVLMNEYNEALKIIDELPE